MHAPPSHDRSLAQLEPHDDPEPGTTWFYTLAGVIILTALVVAIAALFFRTERHEFGIKVLARGEGALPALPTAPLDAKSFEAMQRDIRSKLEDGLIGEAQFLKRSQMLALNAWMTYPWEDAKGETKTLTRIPVREAMRLVAAEMAAKAPTRVADAAPAPTSETDRP